MLVVWRILYIPNKLIETHGINLQISDLTTTYKLRTHGSYHFVQQLISRQPPLVLKASKNDEI
ncbi:hypothetical protein Hanom_Chr05g00472061 [Helianthus anomalus]